MLRSRVNREEIFDLEKYLKLLTSVEKPLQQRLKDHVRTPDSPLGPVIKSLAALRHWEAIGPSLPVEFRQLAFSTDKNHVQS